MSQSAAGLLQLTGKASDYPPVSWKSIFCYILRPSLLFCLNTSNCVPYLFMNLAQSKADELDYIP